MSAPAGWYPDPADPARQRWWDGAQWTVQQQPAAPRYGQYAPAPPVAYGQAKASVETNTVWVWLAIGVSALPIVTLFFLDGSGYVSAMVNSEHDPSAAVSASAAWLMQTLAVSLVSWALMAVAILFCWLDWRELRARGVPQPFHWAWALFALLSGGIVVYMIGRAVVLRRRTVAGGWPPLWAWIGVTVLTFVVAILWTFSFIGEMFSRIGHLPT